MLTLEFDGLYREAPKELHMQRGAGFLCYGWVIFRDSAVIARGHGGYVRGKDASSNVAEYLALIEGLEALLDMGAQHDFVLIRGDAQSVIDQMQGDAAVSAISIKPLYRRANKLAAQFTKAYWNWTPRRYNHDADKLTRRALQHLRANPEQYQQALDKLGSKGSNPARNARLLPVLDLRLYRA
jgi:ribonuclease HI